MGWGLVFVVEEFGGGLFSCFGKGIGGAVGPGGGGGGGDEFVQDELTGDFSYLAFGDAGGGFQCGWCGVADGDGGKDGGFFVGVLVVGALVMDVSHDVEVCLDDVHEGVVLGLLGVDDVVEEGCADGDVGGACEEVVPEGPVALPA